VLGLVFGLHAREACTECNAIARTAARRTTLRSDLQFRFRRRRVPPFILFVAGGEPRHIRAAGTAQLLVVVVTVSMLLAPLARSSRARRSRAGRAARDARSSMRSRDREHRSSSRLRPRRADSSRACCACAAVPFTALEVSYQQVDFVRRYVQQGLLRRMLRRAGVTRSGKTAKPGFFVLAIDGVEASVKTAAVVRKHFRAGPDS